MDPPAEVRVPVDSNVLIGVVPPSLARMNKARVAKNTPVNDSVRESASMSM